jgi:hypothetical protein
MDILAALLLLVGLYIVVPFICVIVTIALLGGVENLLPGAMRDRARARQSPPAEHH